jgi:hypothetical protein
MLARDRQIPALRGEISAENGDLSIPFEQTGYPLNAYKKFSARGNTRIWNSLLSFPTQRKNKKI